MSREPAVNKPFTAFPQTRVRRLIHPESDAIGRPPESSTGIGQPKGKLGQPLSQRHLHPLAPPWIGQTHCPPIQPRQVGHRSAEGYPRNSSQTTWKHETGSNSKPVSPLIQATRFVPALTTVFLDDRQALSGINLGKIGCN